MGEKINSLKEKRMAPRIKLNTITFVVLLGFMLQITSFNKLNYNLKKKKFKKLFSSGTKLPQIDTIRNVLSDYDIEGLEEIHDHVIKTIIKNKVYKNGTIDGFKVGAIDGVEIIDSTKKKIVKGV